MKILALVLRFIEGCVCAELLLPSIFISLFLFVWVCFVLSMFPFFFFLGHKNKYKKKKAPLHHISLFVVVMVVVVVVVVANKPACALKHLGNDSNEKPHMQKKPLKLSNSRAKHTFIQEGKRKCTSIRQKKKAQFVNVPYRYTTMSARTSKFESGAMLRMRGQPLTSTLAKLRQL